MALPNPFGSNLPLQPSFTKTIPNKNLTVNPGPGLPQALQPSYNDVNVIRKHQNDSKHNESNFNRFGFSNSQYCAFSCDRCDRSFKTQELLNSHISEHISCGINGCTFVAHPKIVEKHVEMQHETGLAEQIMRLNTPEEIQKWREARKKYSIVLVIIVASFQCYLTYDLTEISRQLPISHEDKLNSKRKQTEGKFFMNQKRNLVSI